MKIVYCIKGTFNSGGMERVLSNKANYLAKAGHEVIVITTDQKGRDPFFYFDPRIKHFDLEVNYDDNNDEKLVRKIFSYALKQNKHYRKLRKLLPTLNAAIVISMFDHDVSFLYKIKDGSKKIVEIHFSRYKKLQYQRHGLWRVVDRLRSHNELSLVKRYDRFIVLTEEDKKYWGNLPNMQVIYNANSFEPIGLAPLENKVVVAVGRYDYQKGFDNLIKMWRKINLRYPEWKLKIYGHGPLAEEFNTMIDKLALRDVIYLMPPSKNIEQVYRESSILVMTSRYEGFGMVLIEAQSCGVPVVAYACKCGPRDIISSGYDGFLIDEHDEHDFENKVGLLIKDKERRQIMGRNAKETSQRFSEDHVMSQWQKLFDQLLHINS